MARELESPVEPQKALDLLLKELTQFYRTLAMFGTDPELITQVFRQVRLLIMASHMKCLYYFSSGFRSLNWSVLSKGYDSSTLVPSKMIQVA